MLSTSRVFEDAGVNLYMDESTGRASEVRSPTKQLQLGARIRAGSAPGSSGSGGPPPVLRRERFEFDDIFAGSSALGRLSVLARQRTRKALEQGKGLAILCLGCGCAHGSSPDSGGGGGHLEPPVSLLLGSGGGTGLISAAVEEIFRYVQPAASMHSELGRSYPPSDYLRNAATGPMRSLAVKVAYQQMTTRVVLSAVIFTEQGHIFDMLSPASSPSSNHGPSSATSSSPSSASLPYVGFRKGRGRRPQLCNVARVELSTAADFDRVMGMLLGRRAAIEATCDPPSLAAAAAAAAAAEVSGMGARGATGIASSYFESWAGGAGRGGGGGVDVPLVEALAAAYPWVTSSRVPANKQPAQGYYDPQQGWHRRDLGSSGASWGCMSAQAQSHAQRREGREREEERGGTAAAATMLLTVSVSGGGITKAHNVAEFHFVAPCGKNWEQPGMQRLSTLCAILMSINGF